jgi:hypothetical protein
MPQVDYRDLPPERNLIQEIFVWIGVHGDGREAMLSADMPMPFGMRHTPLMSSRRDLAKSMEPIARDIQREAMSRADRYIRLELRTYRCEKAADG